MFNWRHASLYLQILFLFLLCSCQANLAQETVYLTWQNNPSTTMTIQWISPNNEMASVVSYQEKTKQNWKTVEGKSFKFPQSTNYFIHRVELTQLEPDTEYVFKISSTSPQYNFRTMPQELNKEICFVVGGDMYHDGMQFMVKTSQQAAKMNPCFALIGGDIAYAVGSITSSFHQVNRWIDWIKAWNTHMRTPQGHLIPVIAAIGNHDLVGHFNQTPTQALIFNTLFPKSSGNTYDVLQFNSYLSIFILDSGHANPIDGEQTNWLKKNLQENQDVLHRLAIYHVPAYPSIRKFQTEQSVSIRHCWVPLFESLGLHAAFEHHDHAYKRTHPLLKSCIHPDGVVYLGDGGWGVKNPRSLSVNEKKTYLAKFLPIRHFISVTLTPTTQDFKSITDQGKIMDQYVKQLNKEQIKKILLQ